MHPLRIDTLFIKQHHFGKIGNTKTYDQSMNHFNKELCFVRELPFSLKKVVTVCYYFLVKKIGILIDNKTRKRIIHTTGKHCWEILEDLLKV